MSLLPFLSLGHSSEWLFYVLIFSLFRNTMKTMKGEVMFNQPCQYQPYMQRPSDLQFVNGRESAEAYVMPPNSKQILMDSNQARFYLKQTDASGMAIIKAYDFQEVVPAPPQQYVTREEFEELKGMLNHEPITPKHAEPAKHE